MNNSKCYTTRLNFNYASDFSSRAVIVMKFFNPNTIFGHADFISRFELGFRRISKKEKFFRQTKTKTFQCRRIIYDVKNMSFSECFSFIENRQKQKSRNMFPNEKKKEKNFCRDKEDLYRNLCRGFSSMNIRIQMENDE